MLAGILSTTVVLPFALGVALGVVSLRPTWRNAIMPLLFILFALVVLLVLEGIPTFHSLGMKQKLPLIIVAIGLVATIGLAANGRWRTSAAWLISGIAAIGVAWLGQNIIFSSPVKVALALFGALAAPVLASFPSATQAKSGRPAEIGLLAAAFSSVLALSLAAAFGAFLGAAQLNGAMAALLGAASLVLLIAHAMGNDAAFGFDRLTRVVFAAIAAQFIAVAILLTPKLSLAGAALAILCWLVPLGVARFANGLDRFGRLSRFLAVAILTFLPAAASIAMSAFAAFH